MKALTLVTKRLYFGLDALQLRDATGRVLSRVHGLPPHRATVRLDALEQDFRVTPSASRALADEMVESGLLHRLGPDGYEYGITDKFRQYALARIVEPLPRTRAKMLLDHIADLAGHFNRTATQNKYEIEAIAVFGGYMSLDAGLSELTIGVTGRRRVPARRPSDGRATRFIDGHERIRELFETQSQYVQVSFFRHLQDAPRPFSVIFKSDA
ncbi:MAG TPA: hypothetical protein VF959_08195 [Casimicrobiaceae bacterium]